MSRPIPNVTLGGFRPNQVKIDSIGIGIDDDTLNSLDLTSSQYMVVGGQANQIYNLIVDNEGVAINTSISNRGTSNEYALYVDGNIYINGKVDTSSGTLSNVAGGGSGSACNFWLPVRRGVPDSTNIFYDGKINIANESQCRSNAYRVNIIDDANQKILYSQLAIQNQKKGVARMGILGNSNLSPVIINSSKGAIEFHANRDVPYFNSVYYRGNIGVGIGTTVTLDIPYYACNSLAPHMAINSDGTVGIKASPNPPLTYTIRTTDGAIPAEVIPTTITNKPADLHVNGTTFSCNMLIFDYESKLPANIDELYVRRLGITFAASQVVPGSFARGDYTFQSNLSIGGPIEPGYNLSVYGKAHIYEQLYVNKGVFSSNLTIDNTFQVLGTSYFENDVIVNDNLQVNENLVIWGGFYADSNAMYTFVPGENSNETANIQFIQYIANGWSNLYMQGAGFITPGMAGIGVDPNNVADQVPSQLTVISRDENIYAMSLFEKTDPYVTKALFVGHQRSNIIKGTLDASAIFSTPSATNPYFSYTGQPYPQNIYFYPGQYDKTIAGQGTVIDDNPPTLGIFESKHVAVNSFEPPSALQFYVDGNMGYSSNLYKYDKQTNDLTRIAEFKYGPVVGFESGTGISYYDPNAPYMGINRPPNRNYGVAVQGGILSDNYYTANNKKAVMWFDTATDSGILEPSTTDGMYVISKVGIGKNTPQYLLDLYGDNEEIGNDYGTYIRMQKSLMEGMSNTGIRIDGAAKPWFANMEDVSPGISRFAIGCASTVHNVDKPNNNNGIVIQYDTFRGDMGHQIVIGGNSSLINNNPIANAILTVNGDTSIIGNLNVSGYITANNTVTPVPSNRSNVPSIEQDDMFISGKDLYLNPTNKMYINYTCNLLDNPTERPNRSILNVYQDLPDNAPIAHFIGRTDKAFIEIISEQIRDSGTNNDGVLRIGLLTGNTNEQIMGVQDGSGYTYMSFKKSGNTGRAMGINIVQPDAQLHIMNNSIDNKMLRVTFDGETQNYSPNITLERLISGGDTKKQWVIEGPVFGTGNDCLSFTYVKENGSTVESSTVLSITSNGCIGVNTTTPKYLIDVVSSNASDNHGLRLWNKENSDAAQLIFQSGESSDLGGDISADYIMYSCNNEFVFKQRNSLYEPNPLLYFNSNTNLGINTLPNNDYNVNMGGKLNVSDSIYVNGRQVFSRNDYTSNGYIIYGSSNIFLNPDVLQNGGVVINGITSTNNLFHIFNDHTNSPNMTVYDSVLSNLELNFRNKVTGQNNYNLYKLYTSNNNFGISYQQTYDPIRPLAVPNSGWSNVLNINAISETNYHEHDVTLNGTISLISTVRGTPKIAFGSNGEIGGNDTYGSLYLLAGTGSNIGIGTTIPTAPLHVHANAIIGQGLAGSNASIVGGPFFKQQSWDTPGILHTIPYPSYCVGDNSSGMLHIQVTNKSADPMNIKLGNMQASFLKPYNSDVVVTEVSSHKSTSIVSLSISYSSGDIIVTTDEDCSICWTSIGAY